MVSAHGGEPDDGEHHHPDHRERQDEHEEAGRRQGQVVHVLPETQGMLPYTDHRESQKTGRSRRQVVHVLPETIRADSYIGHEFGRNPIHC